MVVNPLNRISSWSIALMIFIMSAGPAVASLGPPARELVRQPRASAMGGADVGLADDEYALFNNPAGLAGQTKREFRLIGLGIEGSMDTYTSLNSSMNAFKNFNVSSLNQFVGKDLALRADYVPMITLPSFAMAYVADVQAALGQYNLANPYFRLTDMVTHGVQAGFGFGSRQKRHGKDEWKFGVAGKLLWRRGGTYNISTGGFLSAASSGQNYLNSLVGGYGAGFGVDLGTQYVNHLDKNATVSMGFSITDVGNTRFSDPHAEMIPMSINWGLGYKYNFSYMKLALDLDLKHLNDQNAFSNKIHFGTDLTLPVIDLYMGLNQMNLTYGVGFDLWVLKLTVLSYAEELGYYFHQSYSRRYMLQVDFDLPI